MITDELEIAKKIFSMLDDGIVNGYDSFEYIVEAHEGYMEEMLVVSLDGVASSDIDRNYDAPRLHMLVASLKKKAFDRGDDWEKFILSFDQGGEVNVNFEYA